jgi:Ca2+:H+ antiporter
MNDDTKEGLDCESTDGAKVEETEEESTLEALRDMIFGKWVSLLLVFMPFAILSHALEWSPASVFWFNFLTMIPLASILGDFTEEVAAHTNEVIGGLVNATFGNAVEVVVVIQALLANEIRVVQASMIGSIFSNLLLVLGTCFLCGGMIYKEQTFNTTAATANMSLLALSGIAMVLPTPFAASYDVEEKEVLIISRVASVFLMSMYLQLLTFQLWTHVHLFEGDGNGETPRISLAVSLFGLCFVTFLVAFFSDYLVGSIDGFVQGSGVSRTFVGLIIIPIVGNAVEHMTAVSVAMKNKMDLAMGVAVGSCVQISLFVVPLSVMVGWAAGKPMTLNFPQFEIILFVLSVLTVQIILSNPKVNWLEGSLLITTYLMIAVGVWYEKVADY